MLMFTISKLKLIIDSLWGKTTILKLINLCKFSFNLLILFIENNKNSKDLKKESNSSFPNNSQKCKIKTLTHLIFYNKITKNIQKKEIISSQISHYLLPRHQS